MNKGIPVLFLLIILIFVSTRYLFVKIGTYSYIMILNVFYILVIADKNRDKKIVFEELKNLKFNSTFKFEHFQK